MEFDTYFSNSLLLLPAAGSGRGVPPDCSARGGMDAGGSSLAMTSLGGCALMLSPGLVTNVVPKHMSSRSSQLSAFAGEFAYRGD